MFFVFTYWYTYNIFSTEFEYCLPDGRGYLDEIVAKHIEFDPVFGD